MSQIGPQDPNQPQYQQHPVYPGPQPVLPPNVPSGYVLKKKSHKFRNFVVFPFVGIVALIVVVTAASGGGSSNTPAADATSKTKTAPQTRNDPREVTPGQAFTIGKHRLNAGWKITHTEYIGSKLVGQVANVSNSTSTAFFSVKFLKDTTVIANFQCSTEELEPHQVQQVECYNAVTTTDRVTGWTKVTAEATL